MTTPHKHHDIICAWAAGWAAGHAVERLDFTERHWLPDNVPSWDVDREYRIVKTRSPVTITFDLVLPLDEDHLLEEAVDYFVVDRRHDGAFEITECINHNPGVGERHVREKYVFLSRVDAEAFLSFITAASVSTTVSGFTIK